MTATCTMGTGAARLPDDMTASSTQSASPAASLSSISTPPVRCRRRLSVSALAHSHGISAKADGKENGEADPPPLGATFDEGRLASQLCHADARQLKVPGKLGAALAGAVVHARNPCEDQNLRLNWIGSAGYWSCSAASSNDDTVCMAAMGSADRSRACGPPSCKQLTSHASTTFMSAPLGLGG